MSRKTVSFLVKVGVSIAILLFLFTRVDFSAEGFWNVISEVDLTLYLLSFLGVIIVLGIKSYRWNLLVNNENFDYKPARSFGAYMSSDAIGIVTPGRIGEIARLYYVRQETDIPFFHAFKTIVSDRIFDFTMLFLFGFSGLAYYLKTFGDLPGIVYVLIILGAIVLAYITGIAIFSFLIRKHWFKRWRVVEFVYASIVAVFGRKSLLMWAITILAYLGYFYFSWLIMHSLRVNTGIADVAFIMSIMSLSTIIPISVAGFGTREAALVILFSQYGISTETAISFSLMHFTSFFLWGGLIGLVYWLLMPISLKQVKEDSLEILRLFKIQPVKKPADNSSRQPE